MTTRHTITRADTMYSQSAYYPPANPLPGLPVSVTNYINFGVIAAASANAICTSQASSGGTNALAINGALATAGVATIPTPRNAVAAWTGTAICTVTGTDYYGVAQTEVSASGTSFTGKKGFATITAVTFSAAVTAATVGTGVKIALPYRVDTNGVLDALMDNLPDVTYTFVPADTTSPATSSTGDVRGTIAASTAPNGTHAYAINVIISDRTGGVGKQVGAYGVTPA
ncbi:MAG TPA: hypothetical protein VLH80_07415 [Nitrospiraceae bacterium]|nr:hypothetical protein [Nitrospiraceae bacterium]